ncbi:MAG TPA: glutathione S-transferase N-terminal domain-containing protein [Candidatus Binataceae bacterium]
MIELYTWGTPNGQKISIALEELAIPYNVHPVNLRADEQKKPEYLKINPNGRIPAIIDTDGPGGQPMTIFESGAILIHLAEKTGKLLPKDQRLRMAAIQWLMFQMSGIGPMYGQAGFFMRQESKNQLAIDRYLAESKRLTGVLNARLGEAEYLAGDEYSIADIATFPWVRLVDFFGVDLGEMLDLRRWIDAIAARPAVVAGLAIPKV